MAEIRVGSAERVKVTQPDTTEKLICVSESLAAGSYAKVGSDGDNDT